MSIPFISPLTTFPIKKLKKKEKKLNAFSFILNHFGEKEKSAKYVLIKKLNFFKNTFIQNHLGGGLDVLDVQ